LLVIRLARTGKKKQAFFRIVVADSHRAVGAKFVEILGNYNPHTKKIEINLEKLEQYMKNGAQPSNTLAKILKKEEVKLPKWVYINERNRPAKKAEENPSTSAQDADKSSEAPKTEAVEPETTEAKTEQPAEAPTTEKEETSETTPEEPKEEPKAEEAEKPAEAPEEEAQEAPKKEDKE
jgi:small subunit ribosomal protein S16